MNKLLAQASINLRVPGGNTGAVNTLTIGQVIGALIKISLVVAAVVFFFMLVVGGVRWIVSGGDKAQTEAARNQITAALIGLVIVFAAWAIAQLAGTFLGVDLFNLNITSVQEIPQQ